MTFENNYSDAISKSSSETTSDCDSINKRPTTYERIQLIYSRDKDGIVSKREFCDFDLDSFSSAVRESNKAVEIYNDFYMFKISSGIVWEYRKRNLWCGVVTEDFESTEFESWFLYLVAKESNVDYPKPGAIGSEIYAEVVAKIFAEELKNTVKDDKWETLGKQKFIKSAKFFTERWQPLEAVLPAFPCKSSNSEKVAGSLPDKGEELAITKLIQFSETIKQLYPPGIIIWIVSDGHVFSDCIAVNDTVVNVYGQALKDLYNKIKPPMLDPIKFCSLPELFSLKAMNFEESLVEDVHLSHHLATELDKESEICRKILVASCDTDSGKLHKDINTENHPRLHLFRGFSKFMTEDLINNPSVEKFSKKKFKKVVAKVAFEMIKRNDAYSNLVELMFPFHLRFSIHSHNNSGPKFGIQLLSPVGPNKCQAIMAIEDHNIPRTDDLLHIPTPWHNCIVKIDNKETFFVVKSSKVEQAIEKGRGSGKWDDGKLHYVFMSN